ncbi:MAG TPA: hypothetical protein VG737_12005 [Cyclobacteriaceae bacterium]|nr:hypothetical protein [Cyclobacteriaceae bacterium]
MKLNSIIAVGLVAVLSASFTGASAQQYGEVPIKILPSSEKGILKVWFATAAGQSVQVKFYDADGTLGSDNIKAGQFLKGFSKKYDVSHLKPGSFWVQVSSKSMDVTYKLVPSPDGRSLEAQLETSTYNHAVVAANN